MLSIRQFFTKIAAGLGLSSFLASANAGQIDLQLTGQVDAATTFTQYVGDVRYDQWFLSLNGVSPDLVVAQGDTLGVAITLDQPFTIPGGSDLTGFLFYLGNSGGSFPAGDTKMSGDFTFRNAGLQTAAVSGYSTTSGQLAAGRFWAPYEFGAITFDQIALSLTIDTLALPATVDLARISYSLVTYPPAPVPEPSSCIMLLAGLGLISGSMMRRRVRPVRAPAQAVPI